ncbi:hypothetical protein L198_06535 [Cryptococcus wingfieldii CBS 7118]|uniref:Uncharacterized protein n=1 Tax=Cryptococcus wingfieldii CBS 7118 TaxID=1295528 RepID=A0A1E3IKU0_9TREE|nr:hypothetical protein L198_06535 [Cryptococcus wingfieldii CBS 7118]ODN89212.1 hypothetical protein L198_06535 [Cryptococcus wingfieldii CBS 7118]
MGFVDRWDTTQALISTRLSKPVRPFLALHLISSSTIFILSILSIETNASTSHFLRHLIDSADLSSVIFVDKRGNIGDWRIAPARVVNITDVQEDGSSNSLVCNDQGTKCKVVEGKTKKVASKQKAEAESESEDSDSDSGSSSDSDFGSDSGFETEFGNSTSTGTANESQSTSTITTVSTLQGNAITTRLLAVPTVVTSSGQVVTTSILMHEADATLADIESSSLSTGNVPTSTSVASSAVTVRTSSSLTASSTSTTALSTSASLVATSTTSASQVVSSVATSSSSVTSNASSLASASPSAQETTESASSASSAWGESSPSSGDEVQAGRRNALSRHPPPPKFYRRRRVEKKNKSNGEDSSDDEQTDSIPSRRDSAKHRSHKRLFFAGARLEIFNTTGSTASIADFIATTATSSEASAVTTATTSADSDSDSGVDSIVLPKGMTVAQLNKLLEEEPDQFEGIITSPKRLTASVPIKSSLDGVKPVQGEDGTIIGANITGITGVGGGVDTFVSQQCAAGFAWSVNSLDNFVREEIVLACFFMWVLGLAVVAVLNESIPHLMALLFSLVLTIAWSANDLRLSFAFWRKFSEMVQNNCGDDSSFFPDYLAKRGHQRTDARAERLGVLETERQLRTFQRIGASSTMNKMYKLVLGLSIILQLDAFVLVTFFALYLDQITRGQASYFMSNCKAFQALYSILVIMLFPWLYFGWKSIRTESRIQFMVFIGLSVFFLAGWAISFASPTFRTTFTHWSFFKALGILALILTVASLVLAVLRRMTFGRGLSEYLEIGDDVGKWTSLGGGGGGLGEKETEVRVEDVRSEGRKEALPTFSTIFGPGPVPPPRRMFSNTQGVQAIRQWQTESNRASSAPSWAAGDDQRRDL